MNKPIEKWEEAFDKEFFANEGNSSDARHTNLKAFIRKTLKQEIARVGEEIIGEAEPTEGGEGHGNMFKNLLKAQQRKHLQEILKAL